MKFSDLNPATMPGYGDPETWGGRTPYGERPDDEGDEMLGLIAKTASFQPYRCWFCRGTFTLDEWDNRHSAGNGEDIHASCCQESGPCSEED